MNTNPRLPRLTETAGWITAFIERFYDLWREHGAEHANLEQTHGEWTPVLSYATPGTLAVTPDASLTMGRWTKQGKLFHCDFSYVSSSFTLGTASGALLITGLPLAPANVTNYTVAAACANSGITKAGYTQIFVLASAGSTSLTFDASGSGVSRSTVTASDTPTGGLIVLRGSITFRID